jgi:pyruvate ferredoxin oxidoreductase beta subunit
MDWCKGVRLIEERRWRQLPGPEFFKGGHTLCPGCPGGVLWRLITKVMGPSSITTMGSTCISLPPAAFPSVLDLPSISLSMANPAALMSGVSAALKVLKRKGKRPRDEKVNVFSVAGDGGTADIGFAGLSGAAERNDDGVYFCFDNEAYMNTGIQRSSLTPQGTWTTSTLQGKLQPKKDVPMIMAAHHIPYVATASIGFPDDLIRKMEKARDMTGGFRYIHVHSPCPTGWRFPENKMVELARLAVECGIWRLYEVENGEFRITHRLDRRTPVRDYLSRQGRFSHLSGEAIEDIQAAIDRELEKYESDQACY